MRREGRYHRVIAGERAGMRLRRGARGGAAARIKQKAKAVLSTGAEIVACGNIGCMTQLQLHLKKLGSAVAVRHTFQVLRDAAAGTLRSKAGSA